MAPVCTGTSAGRCRSMRTYRQYCSIAKALDVVGDRWTLLIIRELLVRGPARYTDIREGVPGIATNLLADRLRELIREGLVSRRDAPQPVAATVFELTERRRELEPVLLALGRWGAWIHLRGPVRRGPVPQPLAGLARRAAPHRRRTGCAPGHRRAERRRRTGRIPECPGARSRPAPVTAVRPTPGSAGASRRALARRAQRTPRSRRRALGGSRVRRRREGHPPHAASRRLTAVRHHQDMTLIAVKVLLAPSFVVGASLAARRFGARVGGLVAGLPVVAGPILLAYAIAHGSHFAANAAAGTLLGLEPGRWRAPPPRFSRWATSSAPHRPRAGRCPCP